jgi:hypothetical protein
MSCPQALRRYSTPPHEIRVQLRSSLSIKGRFRGYDGGIPPRGFLINYLPIDRYAGSRHQNLQGEDDDANRVEEQDGVAFGERCGCALPLSRAFGSIDRGGACFENADLRQRHHTDISGEMPGLSSQRIDGSHVPDHLRRDASVGESYQTKGCHPQHAAVASRQNGRDSAVPKRHLFERPADFSDRSLGGRGRSARRSQRHAAAQTVAN